MQDKESNGSSKTLAEIVARAIIETDWVPFDVADRFALAVLTAIKEAGIPDSVLRDVGAMEGFEAGYPNADKCHREWFHAVLVAMITAGEE